MTTFFAFTPSPLAPFQFQAALDGATYNVAVLWNVFRQGWYVRISSQDGTTVGFRALVASPAGFTISGATWDSGIATITTASPHGYKIGSTIALTISGMSPDGYNGQVMALITGASTFTYALATYPGSATEFGTASYNISLTAGYFSSTLIYREATQQFEISP